MEGERGLTAAKTRLWRMAKPPTPHVTWYPNLATLYRQKRGYHQRTRVMAFIDSAYSCTQVFSSLMLSNIHAHIIPRSNGTGQTMEGNSNISANI